jgi:hypothetical protein
LGRDSTGNSSSGFLVLYWAVGSSFAMSAKTAAGLLEAATSRPYAEEVLSAEG